MVKIIQQQSLTLLLPPKLGSQFAQIFDALGYNILWAATPDKLVRLLEQNSIHVALEWQHAVDDFIVRDILIGHGFSCHILLCKNYKNWSAEEARQLAYDGLLDVPFEVEAASGALETLQQFDPISAVERQIRLLSTIECPKDSDRTRR